MTPIAVITAHAGADCLAECRATWSDEETLPVHVMDGSAGMLAAYELGWREHEAGIYAYLHDDVRIDEPAWWVRVLEQFDAPDVGVVGFGGALVHGSSDLYKTPYQLNQLGRSYYLSNVDDAEVHGTRFTGVNDAAVLDGFALCVRRDLLLKCGGWPVKHLDYVAYDYAICALAHRYGYRCRIVGVRCHHYGGRTAVALKRKENCGDEHERAHRWIYDEFQDVLPWRCL